MIVYNPAAEYRLVDVHSSMNLNRIDLIVYWKDTFSNIHPFELHHWVLGERKAPVQKKRL